MTIKYEWEIKQLVCKPEYQGCKDVVQVVEWKMLGSDGVNTSTVTGTVNLTFDPTAPFAEFADLTEPQVIEWVVAALGKETVDILGCGLQRDLDAQLAPATKIMPAPWTPHFNPIERQEAT